MTTTKDKPVDRDAWRRLLDGGTDGPPELTDARIRAKARQALTTRARRWWLPASLAASMLLAVVLVQLQYERPRAPAIVSEADYAAPAAESPAEAKPDDRSRDESLQRQDSPAPAAPVVPPPMIELPAVNDSRAAREGAADAPAVDATPAPAASAFPASAPEPKREEEVSEIAVTGSRERQADRETSATVTQDTSEDASGRSVANSGALMKSGEPERSPEEWYAEIEKLRAAGRKTEATRELKKLEEAHPGWLEKNHPTDR